MKWCFGKWVWRLLPGGSAALLVGLLSNLGSLQSLEQIAYQTLFQRRGEVAWDSRVVVVKIDDVSLQQIGRFPWRRSHYTQLLNVLSQQEASVVAFDMLWSEPSPDDAQLAQAMMQQGHVVLAQAWDSTGLPLRPTTQLENAAIVTGHILKSEDSDGIVRKVPLAIHEIPVLGFAAVQAYSLVEDSIALPEPNQPLMVNWLQSGQKIPSYSFVEVVRGEIPAHALRDKIVVVGVTATGFDPIVTPFDHHPLTHGVYLQATLINNLLQQNFLQTPPSHWTLLILVLGGPGLSWLLYRYRTGTQLLLAISWVVGWGVLSLLLFKLNYWLPTATPILLFTLTTGNVILYERIRINALLQQQIEQLWQDHYQDLVSSKIINVVTNPLLVDQPISMQRVTQLAALADQFGRSQSTQAAIARNLSVGLLATDLDGRVWFCNPVAEKDLQIKPDSYLQSKLVPDWLSREEWRSAICKIEKNHFHEQEVQVGERWFDLKWEVLRYQQPATPSAVMAEKPDGFLLLIEDKTKRKQDEIALGQLNQQLAERTNQLELVNQELETFSYAVSHDLRAPLRRIDGFSQILLKQSNTQLDQLGQEYLNRIRVSTQRMGELIEDLLNLSRLNRVELCRTKTDLSAMVTTIARELQQSQPDRQVDFFIAPNLYVNVDQRLLEAALENLLGNAWKYTSKRVHTRIEFGVIHENSDSNFFLENERLNGTIAYPVYFIRDNGAGFDMTYANKLFAAFQRLHTADEFPGTGVGLMTVQRIIHRHSGRIWAEGKVDEGATFYFTL
jgi:CHASE2 domain-containing sensor protein/signal transduction histidine kinase